MELTRVHPELRAATKRMPAPPVRRAWVRRLMQLGLRTFGRPKRMGSVDVRDVVDGTVHVRLYEPRAHRGAPRAALLWIHGGGYVIGHPAQDAALCAHYAEQLDMLVVAVDYRLAPEVPFPGPLDDTAGAWAWLLRHAAQLDVDVTRLVIGGQSAGGGLAAALVQRVHDEGGPQPRAQLLFSPMLDDRTAIDVGTNDDRFVWTTALNHFGWSSYLAAAPGAVTVPPYAVPARREDLRGLPATWIGVGSIDLFHDEDIAYAQRLKAADVATDVVVVDGAPHGFESWARTAAVSVDYVEGARRWLERHTRAA